MHTTPQFTGAKLVQVGGALAVAVAVIESLAYGSASLVEAVRHPVWVPATVVSTFALGLILVGLPSVMATHGLATRAFSVVVSFGLFLFAGFLSIQAFVSPVLAADHPAAFAAFFEADPAPAPLLISFIVSSLSLHVGLVGVGVGVLRQRELPSAAASLIIGSSIVSFLATAADLPPGLTVWLHALPLAGLAWLASSVLRRQDVDREVRLPAASGARS